MGRRLQTIPRKRRSLLALAVAAVLAGCVDPNYIGVQDYGSINGRIIDAATDRPLNGAIVSVGSLSVQHTVSDGSFLLDRIPVGTQTLMIQAPGYKTSSLAIAVVKGQAAPAGLVSLVSLLPGAGPAPKSAISLPPSLATPPPSASPAPSGTPLPSVTASADRAP
jgi:hypothetical protein